MLMLLVKHAKIDRLSRLKIRNNVFLFIVYLKQGNILIIYINNTIIVKRT